MKQMNKRYTRILNGRSDEELAVLCNRLEADSVIRDIYAEAGVDDLTWQCGRLAKKMSKIPFLGDKVVGINLFGAMLKDSVKKNYRISLKTKVIIAGAWAYFKMPVDLIPDALPFIGRLDDKKVGMIALASLLKEAADYKNCLLANNNTAFADAVNLAADERLCGNYEEYDNDDYVEEEVQ